MKKYSQFLIVALLSATVAQAAQAAGIDTVSVTITLKNDTVKTYQMAGIDSIRYVNGYFGDDNAIGMKLYLKDHDESVDYLYSQIADIAYATREHADDGNANSNNKGNVYSNFDRYWDLEIPRMSEKGTNSWVTKRTKDYGITWRVEWDNSLIANRWTCYQLHDGNKKANVKRQDAFAEDPDLPANTRSTLSDYKGSGFSRGHLCPSADRLCSREQNRQTFYLSNMQPQWQAHNGGLWMKLENQVRAWADNCDTLYIVKAATIDDISLDGATTSGVYDFKCNNRLPVPKYFYMALLTYDKRTNTYQAIGLWTVHENKTVSNKNYGDYAITIDELEQRTGIDFFCNLPDDIENAVESTFDLNYWHITTSK